SIRKAHRCSRPSYKIASMQITTHRLIIAAAFFSTLAHGAVTRWTPPIISSPQFESHPAFDPKTHDFYFVRSAPDFSGWKMFVSICNKYGWNEPAPPPFAGDGLEADPWFTPDGRDLYFISS